jgi:hypothetical protein
MQQMGDVDHQRHKNTKRQILEAGSSFLACHQLFKKQSSKRSNVSLQLTW